MADKGKWLNEAMADASRRSTAVVSPVIQTAIFIVVTYVAIFSICEVAARELVLAHIENLIDARRASLVEKLAAGAGAAKESFDIQPEIAALQGRKRAVQSLIMIGAERPEFMLGRLERSVLENDRSIAAAGPRARLDFQENMLGTVGKGFEQLSIALASVSSDILLAIAVMACGAIGAMITTLRGGAAMTLQSLCLGIAAGFIVFLSIKGGKHLFLLQSRGDIPAFNPYGSAFAGLIAGLFTEKAYMALSELVDDFIVRLKAAARSEPKRSNDETPPPAQR